MHPLHSPGRIHSGAPSSTVLRCAKAWQTGVRGSLAVLIMIAQIVPALSQPQQRKQPERQPEALRGFEAPLPPDKPSGLNPNERRCFARPGCPTGYRTFCVNPVGASPSCCHQWRVCEKRF
jgi:hypothetical protein